MKSFSIFTEDAVGTTFHRYGSVLGPGLGQYDPIADLNAQTEKEVKKSDLDQIERYADRLFASIGIDVEFTRHFLDRVNDARNIKQITPSELTRLFKQTYKKYGKTISKLGDDAEAVINDMKTDINMPFVLNLKGGELELIAKTVMRKKDFKTSNRKLSFEDVNPRIPRKKGQPAGSKKHSDLYTDENPKGTIHGLKFATVDDAEDSVRKIKNSDRTHAHKIQAAIAMEQRAREMGKISAADVYRSYINKMKKKTKEMQKEDKEDEKLQKTMRIATAKMNVAKRISQTRKQQKSALDRVKDKDRKKQIKKSQDTTIKNIKTTAQSQIKQMQKEEFKFFPDNVYEQITLPEPPTDIGKKIKTVQKVMNERTEQDEISIRNHDEVSFYAIKKYCDENNLEFHDGEFEQIIEDSASTIKYFKDKFDVARPFEVDKSIKPMESKTNKTRSYPSGHATQATLVAKYVMGKFPEHEKPLYEAAKECGFGRVQAGFHFVSDYVVGNLLGEKLYTIMNKDDYGRYVNEAPDTSDAMKRYKSGKAGFTDIAHLKAKGLIKRSDGTKRKSDKYK